MSMKKNRGNILVYTLIVVLLLVILLAVTNPGNDQHIQAIEDNLAREESFSGLVNRGVLAIDPPAYHSVIIVSYTKRKDKLATIGALGYVWVDKNVFKQINR